MSKLIKGERVKISYSAVVRKTFLNSEGKVTTVQVQDDDGNYRVYSVKCLVKRGK